MNIRNVILAIGIITTLFACGSQVGTKVETGVDNIRLNDTHKEVSRIIPSLQRAPEHVSAKRGEGFREYSRRCVLTESFGLFIVLSYHMHTNRPPPKKTKKRGKLDLLLLVQISILIIHKRRNETK